MTAALLGDRDDRVAAASRVVISDAKARTVDHDFQREILAEYDATATSTVTRTEDAVAAALADGRLDFAGLDVTDPEPLPADHPQTDCENALVTPHVARYSEASRRQLSRDIADDVGRVLLGEEPRTEVPADARWL